jgi:hypothetical protein
MTGAIGQRWMETTTKAIFEIVGARDPDTYHTKVVHCPPGVTDYHCTLGREEGYYRDRFGSESGRSGLRFEYLPGQDKPRTA